MTITSSIYAYNLDRIIREGSEPTLIYFFSYHCPCHREIQSILESFNSKLKIYQLDIDKYPKAAPACIFFHQAQALEKLEKFPLESLIAQLELILSGISHSVTERGG